MVIWNLLCRMIHQFTIDLRRQHSMTLTEVAIAKVEASRVELAGVEL